ncbi:SGNH/GDSL hydrolase family protein [Niallia taxi]|uniref:SGNH/GDSL hydrolase family protein n=1 Tax=Niallia taxi TaxID=2499688 RepID=UPI00316B2981
MKAIIITVLSILLTAVLVIGNIHWGNVKTSSLNNISNSPSSSVNNIDSDYYLKFASAWPEDSQKQLESAINNDDTYHILLLGSESIGNLDLGLMSNLREALINTYDKYVSIDSMVFNETTSNYVLNGDTETLIDEKPDMIIFEPFLLSDNNIIDINTTLTNLSTIIKETKEQLPNVTFILQPANPIYNASLYPTQVAALKEYAESENITYLDHWKDWPEGDSNKILDYINQDGTPNKKGYEIWSNYITDFLISE